MKTWILLIALTAWPVWSIPGDLDLDGKVDFDDFFILADNFGREGPPDTLRVTVVDTLKVEKHVDVFDTTTVTVFDTTFTEKIIDVFDTTAITVFDTTVVNLEETVYDTVVVLHPAVGDYTAEEQDNYISSADDPLEGMRESRINHYSNRFRLGPGLAMQEHNTILVYSFEDGQLIRREYLKPSGHILTEIAYGYEVEVLHTATGYFELKYGSFGQQEKTYYYNADMEVVDIETDGYSYSVQSYRWWYLTLNNDGTWTCEEGDTELDRPSFYERYTYAPVDFETELSK